MLGADLFGSAGRMQRIGSEEESIGQFQFVSQQHRYLAASVGLPTEKYPAADARAHQFGGAFQTFAVASRIARPWWSDRPCLAKRQIAAQYQITSFAENRIQGLQQGRVAVAPGSVRENQGIAVWFIRFMQEAADGTRT
jgi:hypothetical protein